MSLGREDVLRELELLPVWRLRTPLADSALPAIELPSAPETSTEKLIEKTATVSLESVIAEPVTELRVESEPAPILEIPENTQPEVTPAPLIQSPWLLLSLQTDDAAAQQLLENIVRALKLTPEELHVSHQPLKAPQVQSQFAILFGLDAANTFLGTNHTDIASIRGQMLTHAEMRYVITHHPDAMLSNPLLKKEVWHDLCLLLAEK
jgi:DNA polymerase